MHPAIREDQHLRELALAEARNKVGPDDALHIFLQREGLSQAEYDDLCRDTAYGRYVTAYVTELQESGFSFSAKARVLAEDLLADIYMMAKDVDTPAAMRVKTLENLVEWGKLAPKKDQNDLPGAGFSVTINLGNPANPTVNVSQTTAPTAPKPFYDSESSTDDVTDVQIKAPVALPADTDAAISRLHDLFTPLSAEELQYYEAEE